MLSGVVQGIADVDWIRALQRGLSIFELVQYLRAQLNPPQPVIAGGVDPTVVFLGGDSVPYNFSPTNFGSADFASGLGSLAGGIASVINAIRSPASMPGGLGFAPAAGSVLARTLPTIIGGAAVGGAAGIADYFLSSGGGGVPTSPFATGGAPGPRAQIFVAANPVTGRATWFRPAGRPILWSSDLSACRRVRKVAGRARRRLGGR